VARPAQSESHTGPAARRSLLELAAARLRADLADFTAHRIVIADPPLGSTVSIRWRLPTRA
jgi:hypothetical protein